MFERDGYMSGVPCWIDTAQPDPRGIASVRGPDGLDDVLARSDYLALTLPLTSETRGLLGESQLRSMKPTAILVNVSRAQIIDEDALYRALAQRRLLPHSTSTTARQFIWPYVKIPSFSAPASL